jgi:hypothetical protein
MITPYNKVFDTSKFMQDIAKSFTILPNSELPVIEKKSIEDVDEVDQLVEQVTGAPCSRCQE